MQYNCSVIKSTFIMPTMFTFWHCYSDVNSTICCSIEVIVIDSVVLDCIIFRGVSNILALTVAVIVAVPWLLWLWLWFIVYNGCNIAFLATFLMGAVKIHRTATVAISIASQMYKSSCSLCNNRIYSHSFNQHSQPGRAAVLSASGCILSDMRLLKGAMSNKFIM